MPAPPNDSDNNTPPDSGSDEILTEFHDGAVIIGDVSIPLASPNVRLSSSTVGRHTLHFLIPAEELERLTEAWQQYVHSKPQVGTNYPVSDLSIVDLSKLSTREENTNSADVNYIDVAYIDVKYRDVTYYDIGPRQASVSDVQYVAVSYVDVSYSDVTYAALDHRTIKHSPAEGPPPELMSLTINGDSRVGKRRIMTVEGIEILHMRQDPNRAEIVEVVAQLTSTFPIDQMLWLIDGE